MQPLTGIHPIAPTPFTGAGDLDLPGHAPGARLHDRPGRGRHLHPRQLFRAVPADRRGAQRRCSTLCLSHVAGRVPVIVTCSHFSTRIAGERAQAAAQAGAAMLMLMPPYHGTGLRADEAGMLAHFAHVAEASRLPIMVQDAPLSGVALSVPFLVRLAREVPGGALLQDRDAGHGRQAARADRAGRRAHRRALRRRGVDHPDGRPRRRRHRDDAERPAAGPHPPGRDASPRRAARRRRRRRTRASCRSSTTRTGSAACARPRPSCARAGSFAATRCAIPSSALHPATRAGLLELARPLQPLALRWGK